MATNLSYTFQAMSSAGSSFSTPVEKLLSKKPDAVYETAVNTDEAVTTNTPIAKKASSQLMLNKGSPKVLGEFDSFTETVSDNTSNFWLALDVLEPMVTNFQGVLSVKNGLLLSALVPIVNLPLQKGNRQFLSETPWGRITEAILTTVTWFPLLYSGSKEILSTTLDTYQEAKDKTGSSKTAQSHALTRGMMETALEVMALVIGPYALMNLSDFLISESFYRSRALFELEGKTFPEIISLIKSKTEFAHEHEFIEKYQLEGKTLAEIEAMPVFVQKGKAVLSNADGLVIKALLRRYKRGEMAASRFLPELGVTITKRIPIIVRETFKQLPKVLRNEMPERIDSTHVLAQLGEVLVKEATEEQLGLSIKFARVKAYLKTQEFKLGSYKTLSSLALLAIWYLTLDPFINQLANSLLMPWAVKHTNRQLAKQGQPAYYPSLKKISGSKKEESANTVKTTSMTFNA